MMTGRGAGEPEDARRQAEVQRRIALVRDLARGRAGDAVLLTSRRNVSWLTLGSSLHVVAGAEATAVPILVGPTGAVAIAPNNEFDRVTAEELAGLPIEVVTVPWHDDAAYDRAIRDRTSGSADPAPESEIEAVLQPIRSVLGPVERERMTWLGSRIRDAMDGTLVAVSPGSTEDSAVADLVGALAADGIRAPVQLAAADDRIRRFRHPLPGATAVRDRLMLIVVGERWGLHVALTGFRELTRPSDELRERAEATASVLRTMVEASVPGATFGDVFAAAESAYARAGYPDEWQLHHQGGSIGYAPRERIATPADETRIEAGMAFAWNPSITGAKAESTVLVDPDGGPPVDVTKPGTV